MALSFDGKNGVKGDVKQPGRLGLLPFETHPSKGRVPYEASAGVPLPAAQGRHILFIEDDRLIADMYRVRLEADGWSVTIAPDGEDGVRQAVANPPALVLLDLLLPRLDGLEVLRSLRAADETRKVPVLIISNATGASGREDEARRLGIVDWIVKANTTPANLAGKVALILAD